MSGNQNVPAPGIKVIGFGSAFVGMGMSLGRAGQRRRERKTARPVSRSRHVSSKKGSSRTSEAVRYDCGPEHGRQAPSPTFETKVRLEPYRGTWSPRASKKVADEAK